MTVRFWLKELVVVSGPQSLSSCPLALGVVKWSRPDGSSGEDRTVTPPGAVALLVDGR